MKVSNTELAQWPELKLHVDMKCRMCGSQHKVHGSWNLDPDTKEKVHPENASLMSMYCPEANGWIIVGICGKRIPDSKFEKPKPKKAKVEPYTPDWERKANALARGFAPEAYPCRECGQPVLHGYCCIYCKSNNP